MQLRAITASPSGPAPPRPRPSVVDTPHAAGEGSSTIVIGSPPWRFTATFIRFLALMK